MLQPLVKFKSHLYFEEKDCVSEAEKALQPAAGSKVNKQRIYGIHHTQKNVPQADNITISV